MWGMCLLVRATPASVNVSHHTQQTKALDNSAWNWQPSVAFKAVGDEGNVFPEAGLSEMCATHAAFECVSCGAAPPGGGGASLQAAAAALCSRKAPCMDGCSYDEDSEAGVR